MDSPTGGTDELFAATGGCGENYIKVQRKEALERITMQQCQRQKAANRACRGHEVPGGVWQRRPMLTTPTDRRDAESSCERQR